MADGRNWGGKRVGAGRKPRPWRVVAHRKRPWTRAFPIRIALSFERDVGASAAVQEAVRLEVRRWQREYANREETGEDEICEVTRVSVTRRRITFSLGANMDECAREVHRFALRLARRINKLLGRRGRVFRERYRVLSKPYVYVPPPPKPWDVRLKEALLERGEELGIIAKYTFASAFMGTTRLVMRGKP
jgi:hypothetical protein